MKTGLFTKSQKGISLTKKGKKFCGLVRVKTITPVLGQQVLGAVVGEAFKTASKTIRGLNGPMRTDGKHTYVEKCGIYAALFEKMLTGTVSTEKMIEFHESTLYRMVDDGMFVNLNYRQFVSQMRSIHLMLPGVTPGHLDRFLEVEAVQEDMTRLWLA